MNRREQSEIDAKNLRFYAEMFGEHRWETPQVAWNVFAQTLGDIASRLELANAELNAIDEALARRPALEGLNNRYDKVSHACETAARMDRELSGVNHQLRVERDITERLAHLAELGKNLAINADDFLHLTCRVDAEGEKRKGIGGGIMTALRKYRSDAEAELRRLHDLRLGQKQGGAA